MKKTFQLAIAFIIAISFIACNTQTKKSKDNTDQKSEKTELERPSDAELHAYKAYHHTRYMVQTAAAAGGTNLLLHTKKLPTEGTDAVVTPASPKSSVFCAYPG